MSHSSDEAQPRLLAHLVYDTKAEPLLAGVRAVVHRARRLLYAVDATELVLQIVPGRQADRVRLTGQVLATGAPVEGADITLHGPTVVTDSTDDEGEFRLLELPMGQYVLDIRTVPGVISVTNLEID